MIQGFLVGKPFERALSEAGLDHSEALLFLFDIQARPDFQLHTLAYTVDFWFIVLGLSVLLRMALHLVHAFRTASMTFLEIPPDPFSEAEASIAEELFAGPAFRDIADRSGGSVARPNRVSGKDPRSFDANKAEDDAPELERDLDDAFDQMLGNKRLSDQSKMRSHEEGIDDDVDKVFEDWRS